METSVPVTRISDQKEVSSKSQPSEDKQNEAQQNVQQPTVSSIACRAIVAKANPTKIRMGPPATLRNWKFHKPLLAVGNASGIVQIFNLATGRLHRELAVHAFSVKGIEWIGLNAFISFAESGSFHGNELNWELHVTELDTGRTVQLKNGRCSENSFIHSVKASHLRQYFIVIYKNNPFEIWDLETLSLLRRVPKKFSGTVAAEWNPLYSKKIDTSNQDSITGEATSGETARVTNPAPLRETFVVTNKKGELFHFSIAGNVVKEISKIPPESTRTKPVTAIAWKSDQVVLGRNDGDISVWDLGQKEPRAVSTMRGQTKKIRFAPGRGNMKILVLFEDGADIWDVRRLRLLSTVSLAGSLFKIEDADWAASDRPVILTSDGTVVVTDLEFKQLVVYNKEAEPYRPNPNKQNNEPCNLQ